MARTPTFLRQLLRQLFLVGGLLLSVEGALQVYFRVTSGSWIALQAPFRVEHIVPQDDKRGFTYRPNFHDPVQFLTFDQFGLRISESLSPPAVGAPVVAALGDSVPFGHGLKDEQSYPFALDKALLERGSPLRVVNAGVSSYNLQQSIEHFRRDVRPNYRPVVVTLQAANDVGLLLHYRGSWTPDKIWTPYDRSLTWSLLVRSATFAVLGNQLLKLTTLGALQGEEQMLKNEERLLEDFVDECSSAGTSVVFLPIDFFYYHTTHLEKNPQLSRWTAWQTESRGADAVADDFNRVMADVARRKGPASGAYFFDTRAYLDERDREPLYIDFLHYSGEGNQRVAEGLLEFLTTNHLL